MQSKKSFSGDLRKLINLLKEKRPFAFNRFSDGEQIILRNQELVLGENLIKVGNATWTGVYKKEDFKHFDPKEHSFYRDRLVDAFMHQQEGYFKGIGCPCCIGNETYQWQLDFCGQDKNDEHLTWANLFLNSNYSAFLGEVFPLFQDYPTVVVCNDKVKLNGLANLKKDFRVGYNAMINDYHKISEIETWIGENKISGHLFLFSASSFAKLAIHQLYSKFPNNTYLDVGTTLNCFWDMSIERQYLGDFWFEREAPADTFKECIW